MFNQFAKWRRRVLLERLAQYVEGTVVEYESADYSFGHCLGEPARLWIKRGPELVEEKSGAKYGPPKFHLDIWLNRILIDDHGFLSGGSYVIYPFGYTTTVSVS